MLNKEFFVVNRKGGNETGAGSKIIWSDDQKTFIIAHYKKNNNVKELSLMFNISQASMRNALHKFGVQTKLTCEKQKEKYPRNSRYFQTIDTPEKAYWLGFLYADGGVTDSGSIHRVRINLAECDYEHLVKFRKAIGAFNTPIKETVKRTNGKEYKGYYISFSDKEMVQDLISKGCFPKKSLKLNFPTEEQVPYNLIYHFIRGYSDGDGTITCSYPHGKEFLPYFSWGLLGTETFLTSVKNILGKPKLKLENKKTHYGLKITGNKQLFNILSKIYTDSCSDIELSRKRNKFNELTLLRMGGEPVNTGCSELHQS